MTQGPSSTDMTNLSTRFNNKLSAGPAAREPPRQQANFSRVPQPTMRTSLAVGAGIIPGQSLNPRDVIDSSDMNSDANWAPPSDANLLSEMKLQIKDLEEENSKLRQKEADDIAAVNVQVFHCLIDGDGEEKAYLSEPYWEIHDQDVSLSCRLHVVDPDGYIETKRNIAFAFYKIYTMEHQRVELEEAMKTKGVIPNPEPASLEILLISNDMREAMRRFLDQFSDFRTEFPEVHETKRLTSPFIWWYHCRRSYNLQHLQPREAKLIATLIHWIEDSYSSLYDQVDDQLRRHRVSSTSIEFLVRHGYVLVSDNDGVPMGYQATSRPRAIDVFNTKHGSQSTSGEAKSRRNWEIKSRSYMYAGNFLWKSMTLTLTLETDTEDGEVDITSLEYVPLAHASEEVRQRLEQRGKTFWKCRNKRLVSYEGFSKAGKAAVRVYPCFAAFIYHLNRMFNST
jgi:hypothetical protein